MILFFNFPSFPFFSASFFVYFFFCVTDADRSGQIDASEASVLAARYLAPTSSASDQKRLGESLRQALDTDGDGKISFKEYSARFGLKLQMQESRKRRGLGARSYQQSKMAKSRNNSNNVFIWFVVIVISVLLYCMYF
tara:strand:- start:356 stop:769 length:414 start_codon:yes stop_codon:yes gene_type:complete